MIIFFSGFGSVFCLFLIELLLILDYNGLKWMFYLIVFSIWFVVKYYLFVRVRLCSSKRGKKKNLIGLWFVWFSLVLDWKLIRVINYFFFEKGFLSYLWVVIDNITVLFLVVLEFLFLVYKMVFVNCKFRIYCKWIRVNVILIWLFRWFFILLDMEMFVW